MSLAVFEFNGENIREENGLYSIYDCLRVIGGKKKETEVWKRLGKKYPEVLAKCQYFKFKGQMQRLTPVGDWQLILEIIGLLPSTRKRIKAIEAIESIAVSTTLNTKELSVILSKDRSHLSKYYDKLYTPYFSRTVKGNSYIYTRI